jgi:hypothetical protein
MSRETRPVSPYQFGRASAATLALEILWPQPTEFPSAVPHSAQDAMTAAEIAERLHARPSGSGWMGHCPGGLHARADRNPSLSIGTGRSGCVVLHCFAGCSLESICAALKIKVSDLFPHSRPTGKDRPRIVRDVERQVANLRSRLTPRERVLPVTVVYCRPENLEAGIARALALAVEREIVQALLEEQV